jgi:hypothetical protein
VEKKTMAEVKTFQCAHCKDRIEVRQEEAAPQCCGQPMTVVAAPLTQCTLASTPEHSRFDDMGEPCDDGRAG